MKLNLNIHFINFFNSSGSHSLIGRNEHMFVAKESPLSSRLYIRGLVPSDSGKYTCNAGPLSSDFDIVVDGKY